MSARIDQPLADHEDDLLTTGVLSRRVIAWFIDLAIIAVIMSLLFVILFTFGLVTLGLGMPLLSTLPIIPPAYHFLSLLTRAAATPGQILLGLTVRRDLDLGRPTPLQALLSTVGLYLTLATGIIWLAVALLTVRRRTLHDMLSGLVVIRRDALATLHGSPRFMGYGTRSYNDV
jgi:uncharacterized RDD family membrane protein YckC